MTDSELRERARGLGFAVTQETRIILLPAGVLRAIVPEYQPFGEWFILPPGGLIQEPEYIQHVIDLIPGNEVSLGYSEIGDVLLCSYLE